MNVLFSNRPFWSRRDRHRSRIASYCVNYLGEVKSVLEKGNGHIFADPLAA
jgi:hypothetical protein